MANADIIVQQVLDLIPKIGDLPTKCEVMLVPHVAGPFLLAHCTGRRIRKIGREKVPRIQEDRSPARPSRFIPRWEDRCRGQRRTGSGRVYRLTGMHPAINSVDRLPPESSTDQRKRDGRALISQFV